MNCSPPFFNVFKGFNFEVTRVRRSLTDSPSVVAKTWTKDVVNASKKSLPKT